MGRGIWLCRRVDGFGDRFMSAPNSDAARRGYPMQKTQGCGYWNVYVSRRPSSADWQTKPVDTRCRHCNRRVRFNPARSEERGRPRSVVFTVYPDDCPQSELIHIVNSKNRGEKIERGFVKARDYQREE
jgi:hypothetical protein